MKGKGGWKSRGKEGERNRWKGGSGKEKRKELENHPQILDRVYSLAVNTGG